MMNTRTDGSEDADTLSLAIESGAKAPKRGRK